MTVRERLVGWFKNGKRESDASHRHPSFLSSSLKFISARAFTKERRERREAAAVAEEDKGGRERIQQAPSAEVF